MPRRYPVEHPGTAYIIAAGRFPSLLPFTETPALRDRSISVKAQVPVFPSFQLALRNTPILSVMFWLALMPHPYFDPRVRWKARPRRRRPDVAAVARFYFL